MTTICNLEFTHMLNQAKWTFVTRNVPVSDAADIDCSMHVARAGDLVLCEITSVGQHKNVQLRSQRMSASYAGDFIVACVGNRYAADQFLGSARISSESADLLAGGGVVGTVEAAHAKMAEPTKIRPIGFLLNKKGKRINLADYAVPNGRIPQNVTVIGVFGAAMNAGKTTAAVSLAHGLKNAGYKVAGIKATGTGAFGDFNAFQDAGVMVKDFTDAGMCSTFGVDLEQLEDAFEALGADAVANGAEVLVVEIADGVFQRETRSILEGSRIKDRMDAVLFAAPDALASVGGVNSLASYGLRPFAISGKVTLSPLSTIEAEEATGIPIVTREQLCDGKLTGDLVRSFVRTNSGAALPIAA